MTFCAKTLTRAPPASKVFWVRKYSEFSLARNEQSKWVGAEGGARKNFVVSVFVPTRTRGGDLIDHERWRLATLTEMARLFGGATAFAGTGAWRDDDRAGSVLVEDVYQIHSYMAGADWNRERATELAIFLRRMGRETDQGEIGLIVNGSYLPIREFSE